MRERRDRYLGVVIVVAAAAASPGLAQDDWVEFDDESAVRIDAAPEVGLDDTEEKDIISGDVDNDGDVDVLIVRKVPFSSPGGLRNVLFLNDGGVFTDVTAEKAPELLDETDDRDVLLADFDGDGWLDIVTAPTFEDNAPPPPFGQPRIYMNRGEDGGEWQGFQWEPDRMPPISPGPENDGPQFCAVAVGDVTGDGLPDIFFADYETTTEDRLLVNDGNGFFTDETETRLTDPEMYVSSFGTDAHILDFNRDGWNDIVRNNTLGPNEVMVVYNDGTGFFDSFDRVYEASPYMIEPGDLNDDGRPDLYVVDDGQDRYMFNLDTDDDGHAIWETHTVTQSPNTQGFGGNTKIADMDGDGILDILVADVDTDAPGCTRRMVVLRGQGTFPDITYSDPFNGAPRPWLLQGVFDVEALDVNGDGRLDLWVGTCDGNRIFVQPSEDPTISIADRGEKELDVGLHLMLFTLSLSSPATEPVTVDYATEDGTAVAGVDYHSASGTVTFAPGEVSTGVFVALIPNTEPQDDRDFFVNLSNSDGGEIEDAQAVGTIFDDDVALRQED